jgi:hypothetical protein
VGQLKLTRFYVLWVKGETHDQVARDANKLRLQEAEVLTRMAPERLQRKRGREEDDDREDAGL